MSNVPSVGELLMMAAKPAIGLALVGAGIGYFFPKKVSVKKGAMYGAGAGGVLGVLHAGSVAMKAKKRSDRIAMRQAKAAQKQVTDVPQSAQNVSQVDFMGGRAAPQPLV